jgi:hypothetical protein
MPKKKLPSRNEVFDAFTEELEEQGAALSGDTKKFKITLHNSFKRFLGNREYKDKYLFEFIFITVDNIIEENTPSQVSDCAIPARAAE